MAIMEYYFFGTGIAKGVTVTPVADTHELVSTERDAPLSMLLFFASSAWSFARSASVARSVPDPVVVTSGV